MKIRIKILLTVFLISGSFLLSQQSRLDALGGLSYSIVDIDSQIDPYILGGNPAWLINSQTNQRLEIYPYLTNSKGNYHRYYESGNVDNFAISFSGITPLGNSGTFRGFATYHYELQKDRNRILTLAPYSGDAFFFTDTTTGDYRYSGPTFELMHSIEILDNLFIGGAVNYKILDGLKKVYTFAETLYHKVSGNIGIAYRFSNNISFGFNYRIFDSQERTTATDVNNGTVQTYLFRGEINRIELRSSSQNYKLKKFGNSFSVQTQIQSIKNLIVGFNAVYLLHNSSSIFPVSSLIDVEDGYTSFNETYITLQARWLQSNTFTFGFTLGYSDNNSWSKNSNRNLTIWKLGVNDVFSGVGLTYSNQSKKILLGVEYELHYISADSSKYIDNKFSAIKELNHVARIGFETELSQTLMLRLGYNFIYKDHDFIFGGENVLTHYLTLGTSITISESFELEPRFEYSTTNLKENNLYKNNFGFYTTLRFYNL